MKKLIPALILTLVVSGCMSLNTLEVATTPATVTADDRAVIAREVTYQLKDPESVRFRDVKTFRTNTGHRIVCGQYNARNGFGGYSGYSGFYLRLSKGKVIAKQVGSGGGADYSGASAIQACRDANAGKLMVNPDA